MGPGVGVGFEMKELLLPKIGPGVGVGVAKLPIVVNMLPKNEPVNCTQMSLFRNKRFMLDKMTRRNTSKFAIFYIRNPNQKYENVFLIFIALGVG